MSEPPFSFPRPKEEIEEELRQMLRDQRKAKADGQTSDFEVGGLLSAVAGVLSDVASSLASSGDSGDGGSCGGGDGGGGGGGD